MIDRVQSVSSLLGDEVVFSMASAGPRDDVPVVMARVQAGQRAALDDRARRAVRRRRRVVPPVFSVRRAGGGVRLAVAPRMGRQSPGSGRRLTVRGSHRGSLHARCRLADRRRRGSGHRDGRGRRRTADQARRHDGREVPLPRAAFPCEERKRTRSRSRSRTLERGWGRGWLTAAPVARRSMCPRMPCSPVTCRCGSPGSCSRSSPRLMSKQQPSFQSDLAELEDKLGAGFVANLTAAMGTEAAFALHGFSASGPTWVMVALANDPAVIDSSLAKVVDTVNAELPPGEQDKRCVLGQESAGGRMWKTLKAGGLPFGVTWTYDGGYLVAASDRATAERAIATRNGGSALVWSAAFQAQLPASAGIHPSAFAWLNTKGALGMLSALSPSPALNGLLAEHDPVLVVFDGKPEQIHVASRTRLSGAIIDAMMLESLGRTLTAPQPNTTRTLSAVNPSPVVELEDLKVKLGRREILHGITCRLGVSGTGKAVGLLGPERRGQVHADPDAARVPPSQRRARPHSRLRLRAQHGRRALAHRLHARERFVHRRHDGRRLRAPDGRALRPAAGSRRSRRRTRSCSTWGSARRAIASCGPTRSG